MLEWEAAAGHVRSARIRLAIDTVTGLAAGRLPGPAPFTRTGRRLPGVVPGLPGPDHAAPADDSGDTFLPLSLAGVAIGPLLQVQAEAFSGAAPVCCAARLRRANPGPAFQIRSPIRRREWGLRGPAGTRT